MFCKPLPLVAPELGDGLVGRHPLAEDDLVGQELQPLAGWKATATKAVAATEIGSAPTL
ncbi:MAG TPA: hypothetical protein VM390_12765 [Acidimicrobiales bacterium]|nr:hypothetical protein [Acidimicrobiales bacterium]